MGYLTKAEAAAYLSVSKRHLVRLGIRCFRLGHNSVRYLAEDLDSFMRQRQEVAPPAVVLAVSAPAPRRRGRKLPPDWLKKAVGLAS